MPKRIHLGLHATVLAIQLAIVLGVAGIVSVASVGILNGVVETEYGERVLAVGHAVALMPAVQEAIDDPDPPATIQPLAESIRRANGLSFVTVANRDRIRLSHPIPERIGQPLSTDNTPALEGTPYVTTEDGSLGRSIRAKVPIYRNGEIVGTVSVGILMDQVNDVLFSYWRQIALITLAALGGGALISFLLSSHIKRQIFGLEPREIATLLEQREAMLHGIREGVLAIDGRGVITLANEQARRLLDLPPDAVGRPVVELLPESALPQVLATGQGQQDQLTLAHNGRAIVVNRVPVRLRGEVVGAVSTFRDQTEVQRLARELNGTRGHLDALRAQAHEFANRLHTVAGLLELGWPDEAIRLIKATTHEQQRLINDLPERIADQALAALLVGKASVAAERGIVLEVTPESRLGASDEMSGDLVTIVGNLIENAFDAVEGRPERLVVVDLRDDGDGEVRLTVRDSGPGVPPELGECIFEDGFTTKAMSGTRGVGLALVRRAVARWDGAIELRDEEGAVFAVRLPRPADSAVPVLASRR
jgi:two-component system CitB family sensor kinase